MTKQCKTWQAWGSPESVTFAPVARIDQLRADGSIADDDVLLHEITAATGEDAMIQHHKRMKWEPYRPLGDPKPCPNNCGELYYPLGYADCPNCGHIG